MRTLLKAGLALVVLYAILSAAFFAVMHLPPEQFAGIMARTPRLLMFILPFEPLWSVARAGTLKIGDPAPDFRLPTPDKSGYVRLSSFRGQRPVVLVFGSYT